MSIVIDGEEALDTTEAKTLLGLTYLEFNHLVRDNQIPYTVIDDIAYYKLSDLQPFVPQGG